MVYQTIPPSSSGACGSTWASYMAEIFQEKTGLDPIEIAQAAASGNETEEFTGPAVAADISVSGAGAAIAVGTTVASCARVTGPNAATAGAARWNPGALAASIAGYFTPVTKRWMIAFRASISATAVAGNTLILGFLNGTAATVSGGLGYTGNQSNWFYAGGIVPVSVDMGTAIDATGNVFVNAYMGNFDLTNVVANMNPGVAADTTVDVASNLPTQKSFPLIFISGSGAQASAGRVDVDCITCLYER